MKVCGNCGKEIERRPRLSDRQWAKRKYCSIKCSAAVCPPPRQKPKPLADRFWIKVDIRGPDECWPWKAGGDARGYGMIHAINTGKTPCKGDLTTHVKRAHVVAFTLSGGVLPPGMLVCHSCDNPPCCNPEHLYAGTHQTNVDDREQRGRSNRRLGEQHGQAKLTVVAIRKIRAAPRYRGAAAALGRRLGVHRNTILAIQKRRTWRHVQ